MLILIGVLTILWEFDIIKMGKHSHGHVHVENKSGVHTEHIHEVDQSNEEEIVSIEHSHFLGVKKDTQAIAGIGIIHGLASNDELLILLTLTLGLDSFGVVFLGLVIFSLGVVVGMVIWATVLNAPILRAQKETITKTFSVGIAILAIIYGLYTLLGGDGINLLPVVNE